MRRGLASHVCAEQIRVALLEARPAGLTSRQLVAATGLSVAQVRRGIGHLREVLASQHLQPLIWTCRDGYRLNPSVEDLIAYELAQFHMQLTRISTSPTTGPRGCVARSTPWKPAARDTGYGEFLHQALARSGYTWVRNGRRQS